MFVTISLYNHTAKRFADGSNAVSNSYKVKLLTAATFNASHTTLAATGGTERVSGNGYTTGGKSLTNVSVTTIATDGAKFNADDVVWSANGGNIAAAYAILYNSTDADDPPVAFIDFGGTQTAPDGTDFKITWDSSGILTFKVF